MGKKTKRRDRKKAVQVYRYKRKPYRHQVAALKDLLSRSWGGALLMEPRTGKTQVAIDYASILHQMGRVNRVLVVAPNSVLGVWEEEIAAVCPYPHRVVMWDKRGRKRQELPKFGKDVLDFVIVNYDAFQVPGRIREYRDVKNDEGEVVGQEIIRSKSRGGRFEMKRHFIAWQPQLIVLDESHRIKSPSAKKTTTLWSIGKVADFRVIATGTAVTKKRRVFDIYAQWKFLDPDGWISGYTLESFKGEFGRWKRERGWDRWLGNVNEDLLHRRVHRDAFAVARDECFDLPPSRIQIVPVELTGHTAEVYDEMAEEMIARIKTGEITEAQIKLVQSMRLAQISSGIARTSPTVERPEGRLVRLGSDKLDVLKDRLVDWFEADEKVVVAARFRGDIYSIRKVGEALRVPVFVLQGGVPRRQRDTDRRRFNAHVGPALFIMQPQAGALGIDLRSAGTMVWYSLTNSYVDWTQCCDRIALNPHGTLYVYLLAEGADHVMYQGLQEDGDVAKAIVKSPQALRRNFKR